MRTLIKHTSAGMMALLTVAFILLFALVAKAQAPLIIQGDILSPEEVISTETLELITPDGGTMTLPLRSGKRFKVAIHEVGVHFLCVHKPGCRTKVVVIDTRHHDSRPDSKPVRFDVALEPADAVVNGHDVHLAGSVRFHRSNGRLVAEQLPYTPTDFAVLVAADPQ